MMIAPVPTWLLDFGLAVSFALAVVIFSASALARSPLEFSSFPTILVISLVLRLSLNISSTKLIIGNGHNGPSSAGTVIEGFARFVAGGNVALGAIVFLIFLIVNFIVITKGATRMAEVAARFALDAMPGKQLAIDSDVSSGAIDHKEARERRNREQAETGFFGSLDGASKFVKGDAIAGLLITILNLVAGIAIGTAAYKLPFYDAINNYALLTIGDGLVNQIPAIIISISAAMILSKGNTGNAIGSNIADQILTNQSILIIAVITLISFAIVPGLPSIPFLIIALFIAGLIWRQKNYTTEAENQSNDDEPSAKPVNTISDTLCLDEIEIAFAHDLIDLVLFNKHGLTERIDGIRHHLAKNYGTIVPEIRLTDNAQLDNGTYEISIYGVPSAKGKLYPGKVLLLSDDTDTILNSGISVSEPVYGAPAIWVTPNTNKKSDLSERNEIEPEEVLATHLIEVLKESFPQLLTLSSLQRLLIAHKTVSTTERAVANRAFLDEYIPQKVPYEILLQVLRQLLSERISIRNLILIVEAISESQMLNLTPAQQYEFVRQRIAPHILESIKDSNQQLQVIQISPEWESEFQILSEPMQSNNAVLSPNRASDLVRKVAAAIASPKTGTVPLSLITQSQYRRYIQDTLKRFNVILPVISYEELDNKTRVKVVNTITP
jgi:flagellar biosynthesis protein FlhA